MSTPDEFNVRVQLFVRRVLFEGDQFEIFFCRLAPTAVPAPPGIAKFFKNALVYLRFLAAVSQNATEIVICFSISFS